MGDSMEVVVVDNNPTAGLEELMTVRNWNFRYIYVENPANDGFGAGNNRGVERASAPILLFLNPDTVLVEDIITPTLNKIETSPHEVVGYSLIDVEGHANNSFSYMPEYLWFFPFFHFLERISKLWFINHWHWLNRMVWPWGAAFALRKGSFVEAGMFDEQIFLCNEEPDLMRRIPQRHITILPNHIIHLEGHGREVPVKRYTAYLKSLDYYLTKHRIKGVKFFWYYFALKLTLKKWLRRGKSDNMSIAYDVFVKDK